MANKGLGRGLEALIPSGGELGGTDSGGMKKVPVGSIKPNRYQARKRFRKEEIESLASSIKEKGIIQPLLVSESVVPGEYELIAGERRLRAAKSVKLQEVPVIVRSVTEEERSQISLIENLQREDLNPIEEAAAYRNFMDDFKHTQESLAQLLGMDRSVVANTLRLLNLSGEIRDLISEGVMSPGHGRILAGIETPSRQKELARRILKEKLTVRDIENIVKAWKKGAGVPSRKKKRAAEVMDLENSLQKALGTKVQVLARGKKGRIVIYFWSLDELDKLLKILKPPRKKQKAGRK